VLTCQRRSWCQKFRGLFGCRPEIAKPKFGSSHNYGKPYFVAKVLHLVGDKNLAKKQWQLFGLLP
jgi:hypothetical protein